MGWMTEQSGFDSRRAETFLFSSTRFRPAVGHMQPRVQWLLEAVFLEVQWSRCENDDSSSLSSAKL